ncbi:MAG: glycosyltransferase family 2 protein [Hyphomonadaceae bacterium]
MPSPQTATAIVIAAYNAEATLERAVTSALAQPEAAEICIVDDASTDGTAPLARALAARDARVSVHVLTLNGGPSVARNLAIASTSSPWLTILDADDYMADGRLAALHALSGDADFVADRLVRTPLGEEPHWRRGEPNAQTLSFTSFVLGNLGGAGALDMGFMKPLMRRAFLDAHGLRYQAAMRLGEDYELYARALAQGARFVTCGEAGYISVERPGSLSKEHSERDLQLLRDCDKGIGAVRAFTQEERRALHRHWQSVDRRLQWRRLITAVKTRDASMALSAFHTVDAAAFLVGKLAEQVWLRSTGRGPHRPPLSTSGAH